MQSANRKREASALRRLEELPGIVDVVWATVTRLATMPVPTCVLFTAAEKQAGTSLLASATAIGLSQNLRVPVCLVETNVQRPAVAEYLGLEPTGLSDVLDGRATFEDCLQEPRDCPGLLVLPAGRQRAPVAGELASAHLISILDDLKQRCSYLVLDAAPVLEQVDSRLLLGRADASVLVLRARATRRRCAEQAHDILLESGTPVLGSIFNAYRADGFFGDKGRADREFDLAVAGERLRPSLVVPSKSTITPSVGVLTPAVEHEELTAQINGEPAIAEEVLSFAARPPGDLEANPSDRRTIDVLERRIIKLSKLLEHTEAELRRIAAMKNVDLGVASIYRSVQGLAAEQDAQGVKRSLMKRIFQANLELKTALARNH